MSPRVAGRLEAWTLRRPNDDVIVGAIFRHEQRNGQLQWSVAFDSEALREPSDWDWIVPEVGRLVCGLTLMKVTA